MKILFINSVFGVKSTGTLLKQIAENELANKNEVMVLYGRGKSKEQYAMKICSFFAFLINVLISRLTGKIWSSHLKRNTKKCINLIEKFKPDVINIHQLYGYYINQSMLINYIKERKYKTFITLHDFTLLTAKCGYPLECEKYSVHCEKCPRKKEYPKSFFFDKTSFDFKIKKEEFNNAHSIQFIAVSFWLSKCAQKSSIISNNNICVIQNGIDSRVFHYNRNVIKKKQVLVCSSNFKDKIKGKDFLIEIIEQTLKLDPSITFCLAGKNSTYIVKKTNFKDRVKSLGIVSKEKISCLMNESKITLIPSLSETFSLPTAESLCCGTPVIGAKGTGAPEFMGEKLYCNFSLPRDPNIISEEIISTINKSFNYAFISNKNIEKFSLKKMLNQYHKMFIEARND